jgi:hypothetical protein
MKVYGILLSPYFGTPIASFWEYGAVARYGRLRMHNHCGYSCAQEGIDLHDRATERVPQRL